MSKYIGVDKLVTHLKDELEGCEKPVGGIACGKSVAYVTALGLKMAISFAETLPTADVAEVRHGHWITEKEALEIDRYDLAYTCSVCGHCDWDCTESEYFNYCPKCGAKMDGERSKTDE